MLTGKTSDNTSDVRRGIEMGRITVDLPDELEKKMRFKTIERFSGRKGDLSRAVEEAVRAWVNKEDK